MCFNDWFPASIKNKIFISYWSLWFHERKHTAINLKPLQSAPCSFYSKIFFYHVGTVNRWKIIIHQCFNLRIVYCRFNHEKHFSLCLYILCTIHHSTFSRRKVSLLFHLQRDVKYLRIKWISRVESQTSKRARIYCYAILFASTW